MKILLIAMYHPDLVRGGSQQVAYEVFLGLQNMPGVEPVLLCSIDQNSPALFENDAQIMGFDGRKNEYLFRSYGYDQFWQRLQKPQQAQAFVQFLLQLQPDVVHFHHFLAYGIDYLTLVKKTLPQARIIFTAHEFLSICADDGQMLRKHENALCSKASQVRCHQCLPQHRPEAFFLREQWMKAHLEVVDVFTVPSGFMIPFFVDWGLDKKKFRHVPNGFDLPAPVLSISSLHNRFGFFGQLVDAKGIHLLLDAVTILRAEGFKDFSVEINGENIHFATPSNRKLIEDFLAEEASRPLSDRNVFLNGGYHHSQLASRMSRVGWVIVPSIWWESFGLVMSEAWHCGRPVMASNQGGMAERVQDGVNGLLFERADARALAWLMRRAATQPELWEKLSGGITPPPSRNEMMQGYLAAYEAVG